MDKWSQEDLDARTLFGSRHTYYSGHTRAEADVQTRISKARAGFYINVYDKRPEGSLG